MASQRVRASYGANTMQTPNAALATATILVGETLPLALARCEVLRGDSLSSRVRAEARRSLAPRRRRPKGFYRFDRS